MMRKLASAIGLASILLVLGHTTGHAQTSVRVAVEVPGSRVDLSYFYQNLSSDGDWFQDPVRGWCWTPYDMAADWRPYYDGNWEYTDYGWSWVSNESFGWATYHYGRWFYDDAYGWAWVPGTEWAPAWVAWRSNDEYVGWAPLPPDADWDDTRGLTFANAGEIRSDEWCFVPQANLLDVHVNLQVTEIARNVTLYGESRDMTRYEVRSGRPANVGFAVASVEARVGHGVARVTIGDTDASQRGRGQVTGAGTVGYFRPQVQRAPVAQSPGPGDMHRGNAIAPADLRVLQAAQQARLEKDLEFEHARLLSDQDREQRAQPAGPKADAMAKQHAIERQAFTARSAQQHQVLTQRFQKRVVRPGNGPPAPAANTPPPTAPAGNGHDNPNRPGNGNGKGNGGDKGGN